MDETSKLIDSGLFRVKCDSTRQKLLESPKQCYAIAENIMKDLIKMRSEVEKDWIV